jgi:uncharacterized membrane protein
VKEILGVIASGVEGSGAALVVLVVLVAAFIYALAVVVLFLLGRAAPAGPGWATFGVPALCVAGLGVAGYLTYVETRQVTAICGPVGDCNTVQSSPYATLLGFIPLGLVGIMGYLAILSAWVIAHFHKGRLGELAAAAVFAFALFGVLFSLYLTYLELAVILAVCMWCLTSALIMAALLVLASGSALARLAPAEEVDS